MNTYFTSDTHFSHHNIIKYCNRPFKDAAEMDQVMIDNWNSVVGSEDTVYHLGDVYFGPEKRWNEIFHQLKFGTLYILEGNHDKGFAAWYRFKQPENVHFLPSYYRTKVGGKDIILSHYPILEWDKCHRGSYHLYGHVHNSNPCTAINQYRSMNVGVDMQNFTPVSIDQVIAELEPKPHMSHH